MEKVIKRVSILVGCCVLTGVVYGEPRQVTLRFPLVYADLKQVQEPKLDEATVHVNESPAIAGSLVVSFDEGAGQVEKRVQISALDKAGNPTFGPVTANIPFLPVRQAMKFPIPIGEPVELNDRRIREFYNDYSDELPDTMVMQHFTNLRVATIRVLSEEQTGWSGRTENRAVYAYLRVAKDLASQRHIEVDTVTERAAEWLRGKATEGAPAFTNSILQGKEDALSLVREIRGYQTQRFRGLYDRIVQDYPPTSAARCPLLRGVEQAAKPYTDDSRDPGLADVTASIATALGECLYKEALAANASQNPALGADLAKHAEALAKIESRTSLNPKMRGLVRAQKKVFESIGF